MAKIDGKSGCEFAGGEASATGTKATFVAWKAAVCSFRAEASLPIGEASPPVDSQPDLKVNSAQYDQQETKKKRAFFAKQWEQRS